MDAEDMTDGEVVEVCRKEMQAIIDRTDFSVPQKDLLDSVGLPHRDVRLFAIDLTEIGKFDLVLPAEITAGQPKFVVNFMQRHFVYRQKDGRVITLQLRQRLHLRAVGYAIAHGFINDVGSRN